MIGRNLGVGDPIVDSRSSSDEIRTLAWIHDGVVNVLIICKFDQPRAIHLQGIEKVLTFMKVDNSIPWEMPSLQTGIISSDEVLNLNGYAVVLLQSPVL
jgi:hypothetical protein